MKKLMVLLAVVACAISAQATITVQMSGMFGGDDTVANYSAFGFNSTKYTLDTLTAYLNNSDEYATRIAGLQSGLEAKNFYGTFSDKGTYLQANNTRSSAQGIAGSGNYFTVIQYASATDWAFRIVDMGSSSASNPKFQDYGTATGSWGGWTTVPEPTSGLLMLLGVAGLALRRKQK